MFEPILTVPNSRDNLKEKNCHMTQKCSPVHTECATIIEGAKQLSTDDPRVQSPSISISPAVRNFLRKGAFEGRRCQFVSFCT